MTIEIIDAKDMIRSYHKGLPLLSAEDTESQTEHSSIRLVDIKSTRSHKANIETKVEIKDIPLYQKEDIIHSFDKCCTSLSNQQTKRYRAKYRNFVQVNPAMNEKTIKSHRKLVQVVPDTITEDIENNVSTLRDDIMMIREFRVALSVLKYGVEKHDYNLFEKILDKRREIYKETGYLISIKMIVDKTIKEGMKKVNEETM